jgi:hypothetical protein
MYMIPVVASSIRAVGYDAATQQMCIIFPDGHRKDFCDVPSTVFEGLLRTPMVVYYNAYIRDRYKCK